MYKVVFYCMASICMPSLNFLWLQICLLLINGHSAVNIAWLNEDGFSSVNKVSGAKRERSETVLQDMRSQEPVNLYLLRKNIPPSLSMSLALAGLTTTPDFFLNGPAP